MRWKPSDILASTWETNESHWQIAPSFGGFLHLYLLEGNVDHFLKMSWNSTDVSVVLLQQQQQEKGKSINVKNRRKSRRRRLAPQAGSGDDNHRWAKGGGGSGSRPPWSAKIGPLKAKHLAINRGVCCLFLRYWFCKVDFLLCNRKKLTPSPGPSTFTQQHPKMGKA